MKLDVRTPEGLAEVRALSPFDILDVGRGKWLKHVVAVDEEAGTCLQLVINEKGYALIAEGQTEFQTRELRGRFKIIRREQVEA